MGRLGPADEFERDSAFLFALGVFFLGGGLHFLEEVGVIHLVGVAVLHIALVGIADDDGPVVLVHRALVGGEDEAENAGVLGIVPEVVQDFVGIGGVKIAEVGREIDLGEAVLEGDGAGLPLKRRDDGLALLMGHLGQRGRVVGAHHQAGH